MKIRIRVFLAIAILIAWFPQHWAPRVASAACETQILRVVDPPFRASKFGFDVAMDGDYVVVGAPIDSEIASSAGAAHVIRKDGADWVFQVKLTASDGRFQDNFGFAVDIEGDVIVIGAPHVDVAGRGRGKAYVFRRNHNETPIFPDDDFWEEEAVLIATNPREEESLGRSVSISGDAIVLGTSTISFQVGRAIVFQYSNGKWKEQDVLVNSEAELEDGFGSSVTIESDIIVVGAPLDDDLIVGPRAGSAYIFKKYGDRWVEEAKLTASDIQRTAFFGSDLALSNSQLVIGAPFTDGSIFAGTAYVFQSIENLWIETTKLTPFDGRPGILFGSSVDILDDTMLIGSPAGAYLYSYDNDVWVFQEKITPSKIESETFGVRSVTLSNDNALMGSYGEIVVYRIHEDCLTMADFADFQLCFGQDTSLREECSRFDLVKDQTINIDDFQAILPIIQSP